MVMRLNKWNDYFGGEHAGKTNVIMINPKYIYSASPLCGCNWPLYDSYENVLQSEIEKMNASGDKYIRLYLTGNESTRSLSLTPTNTMIFIRLKAILVVDSNKHKIQIRLVFANESWYKVDDNTLDFIIRELEEEGLWTVENSTL